ncbi:glycoside hydrolase family 25 protein [Cryobacterium zhongshanensis]|uniref:Glycoside hydrolase family 25 protein n=1 Tax=Cryobacterium zhongshanensis TaxID=2928153 RepID=A0AA41UGI8_9MICO|nr:glycoside hydrolase family 25 protein [Cryobacterium zhongshanensis]MCI4658985.1 glycoside hydrolase family 25 protein [Cryobacterium zhongshanensis]
MGRHNRASATWSGRQIGWRAGVGILAVLLSVAGITTAAPRADAEVPVAVAAATSSPDSAAIPSVKALDSDQVITDPAWFAAAYAEGFRLYILATTEWGTCTPAARTQPQLQLALDAGLKVAAYTRDPACWQAGIAATGPYSTVLQFFALDIETGSPPLTRDMITGVQGLGVRPVIYSGAAMWPLLMGTSTEFSDVALWDTSTGPLDYPSWTADVLAPRPVPYGGWNDPENLRIGVQQEFERTLNGVRVDLNSFDAAFLY